MNSLYFKHTLVRVALFLSLFLVAFSCDQADFDEPDEVEDHPVAEQETQTGAVTLSPYFDGHLLIAHRGLPDYPENTYVSFYSSQ